MKNTKMPALRKTANNESPRNANERAHSWWQRSLIWTAACMVLAGFSGGCQELVHMGQISDRDSSWCVSGVQIEQQQSDGTWKSLGETDGGGRWWIMKDRIRGGGRIRLSKPGYYNRTMGEAEFLQESNILLIPGGGGDMDENPARQWQGGQGAPGYRPR